MRAEDGGILRGEAGIGMGVVIETEIFQSRKAKDNRFFSKLRNRRICILLRRR